METTITFETMPSAIGRLLAKVEGLERRLDATSAPPPPQPDYVTLKEARDILRGTVTVGTIYNWKSQGRISAIKIGRKLLFLRTDIEAMLKGNYTPTAAEQDAAIAAEANALLVDAVKPKRKTVRP
jgi:excisionase family DNA binding protein